MLAGTIAAAFATSVLAASDTERPDAEANDQSTASAGKPSESGALKVEGLVYRRKGLENVPFTTLGDAPGAATSFIPFTSSELGGDDYTAGVRGTLQGTLFGQPIDVSAFYINPFQASLRKLNLSGAGGRNTDPIYDNAPGSDIVSVNSDNIFGLDINHQTKLYGAEANAVRAFGIPGLSIGIRSIYFGEQLSSTSMDTVADVPGLGAGNIRDHISIRTDNYLVGLQLGFEKMFEVADGFRIGGGVKGGLYNNFTRRERTYVSENRPDLRSFETTDSANVFAQGVELNPRVDVRLAENVFLTASGSLLWLNNVGTALPAYAGAEDVDGGRAAQAKSDTFVYGGSLGLSFLLDSASKPAGQLALPVAGAPASMTDLEERIAELEESAARKGNSKVSLEISGWVNRMILTYDDGGERNAHIVDNTASRSRFNFSGAAKIARGWSAGYLISMGLDDRAANDIDQFGPTPPDGITLRNSEWWLRSNQLGTVTVGLASTATDNIILKDAGGIMAGAANIATIGGSLIVRRADSYEQGGNALITRTTLNDISGGASVDTLRRNVVRYDAPRISGYWGNLDSSAAWGEDDFYDLAVEYGVAYNDWKFLAGAGYLHDTSESGRANSRRNRSEVKGSASLLHIPSGLFGTAAYVHREFNGFDTSDQAIFGENTVGLVTPPGSNRPALDYLYTAFGMRRSYWSGGETSVYGEYAQVDDAITGLREADLREITSSKLQMVGAAVNQQVDDAAMEVYAGFRYFIYETEGVQLRGVVPTVQSPAPLTDLLIGYAGTRIKF